MGPARVERIRSCRLLDESACFIVFWPSKRFYSVQLSTPFMAYLRLLPLLHNQGPPPSFLSCSFDFVPCIKLTVADMHQSTPSLVM